MKHVSPKLHRAKIKSMKQAKQQELLDDSIITYKLVRLPENIKWQK